MLDFLHPPHPNPHTHTFPAHSPIFSVITADVSWAVFRHSSHLHLPPSPIPTAGMARWSDCRVALSGEIHFRCRSEVRGTPRLQVRLSCWPKIKSVLGDAATVERINKSQRERAKVLTETAIMVKKKKRFPPCLLFSAVSHQIEKKLFSFKISEIKDKNPLYAIHLWRPRITTCLILSASRNVHLTLTYFPTRWPEWTCSALRRCQSSGCKRSRPGSRLPRAFWLNQNSGFLNLKQGSALCFGLPSRRPAPPGRGWRAFALQQKPGLTSTWGRTASGLLGGPWLWFAPR